MKRIIVILASLVALTACSSPIDMPGVDERNENFTPIQLSAVQQEITTDVNSLAFDMLEYQVVEPRSVKDVFLSPLSLSATLSMLANGANGVTYEQIASVLGFKNKSVEDINAYYNLIIDALVNADRKVEFTSANSVWVDPEFELLDSYVNTVENNYAASVENVDMGTQKGVDRINKWCSTYTNGKITKFLDKPNDALLVLLTNALYFNGAWKDEFKTVENRMFTHANGTPKYIPTILSSGQYTYYEDECIQLVEILYGNGAYAMDLILPIEDMTLKEAAGYLSEDGVWNNVMNNLSDGYVSLLFPKFRIESDLMLNEMLCKFGMEDAFGSLADFSKMAEDGLMVSFVLQKTYVDVTEKGTEAAAITGSGLAGASPNYSMRFVANRPFFFLIRERSTGVILFVGLKA